MKNPDFLQPWGCPWHGLIKNGQLHLPEGKTLAWPQPTNGDTHLIDFGVPAVETSEDHAEQGKQWLNKAIIAGGYLHGVELPAGSWIYRDSNDENWLVECSLHGGRANDSAFTVKLTRFGVIGGKKVEHEHAFPMPDLSGEYAGISGTPSFSVNSVRPDGAAVIYSANWLGAPLFWCELTLSGSAAALSASYSVVRSRADTMGVLTTAGTPYKDLRGTANDLLERYSIRTSVSTSDSGSDAWPVCDMVREHTEAPGMVNGGEAPGEVGNLTTIVASHEYTAARDGIVVGLVYDAAGSKIDVTASIEVVEELEAGAPSVTGVTPQVDLEEYFPDTASQACGSITTRESRYSISILDQLEYRLSCTLSLRFGSAAPLETTMTSSQVVTSHMTLTGPDLGVVNGKVVSGTSTRVFHGEGGVTYTLETDYLSTREPYVDGKIPDYGPVWILSTLPEWGAAEWHGGPVLATIPGMVDDNYYASGTNSNPPADKFNYPASGTVQAERHSNNVFGATKRLRGRINTSSVLSGDIGGEVATPAGVAPVPPIEDGHLYTVRASYNPVTGAAERDTTSVSWT